MLYELFLIMVFGFIIYHFYINVTNYLNIGTPFVEGMTSQKKISNFFPSNNINKRGKPMDSASGSLSQVKTIPTLLSTHQPSSGLGLESGWLDGRWKL